MKIAKFLKIIMALLLCIALIRAINNAGRISLTDLLQDISEIDYDLSDFKEITEVFQNGQIRQSLTWDDSLDGIQGFVENIFNICIGFFNMIADITRIMIINMWTIIVESIQLIGQILRITLNILGITGT